jgi:hypothetical protein
MDPGPQRCPLLPVGSTGLIQVRGHLIPVKPQIALLVCMAEEVKELVMRLKRPDRRMLKAVERNVCAAQIQRRDANICGREHIEKIAASRGNRKNMLTVLEAEGFEIHLRVFPDLGVDKMIEQGGKETI